MKKKIIVSVTNDLVTDQRVHKVCTTLVQAGYTIELVGRKFRQSQPLNRPYQTTRMRLLFNRSVFFYAEYNFRLFFYLLFSKSDIFLSNDTDSLIANYFASRIRNKKLIFDAHEMFPEVPEVADRKFVKSVWTGIENFIFPKLKHCYTVCKSIADIYNERYGINMQVVRNIPFAQVRQSTGNISLQTNGKHVLLYQGAVNIGRGIEYIIDAMPLLEDFIFFIIGDGDVRQEMENRVQALNVEDRVKFIGRIPFENLPFYTAYADIGLSILDNKGLNYFYSLPNRIFDFIRAGVPILASDFPEINRIISHYHVGKLIDHYQPEYLASVIKQMIEEEKNTNAFEKASKELTWENESIVLIKLVNDTANNT